MKSEFEQSPQDVEYDRNFYADGPFLRRHVAEKNPQAFQRRRGGWASRLIVAGFILTALFLLARAFHGG